MNFPWTWIENDIETAHAVLDTLEAEPIIAWDLETTGLDFNRSFVHGIALANADHAWYISHEAYTGIEERLKTFLDRDDVEYRVWNGIFDLHYILKIEPKKLFDGMIAQWLVDENVELGLKAQAERRGFSKDPLPTFKDLLKEAKSRLKKKRMDQVTIWEVDQAMLAEYAARDARLTYDICNALRDELHLEKLHEYYWEKEVPFIHTLRRIEECGFNLDLQALEEIKKGLKAQVKDLNEQWVAQAGDVNHRSNKQLPEYLFETLGLKASRTTKSGAMSTDVLSLERLRHTDKTGAVDLVLNIRQTEKMLKTYVMRFLEDSYEGKLFGRFKRTGTVTGRLSSSDPNLQNIPSFGDWGDRIRGTFIAPPGHVVIVCDYSQIELRLLAHYSKDPIFLKVFREGLDPHQQTADLLGILRKYAKNVNFGWIYGIGSYKLADTIEKALGERPNTRDTRLWLDTFDKKYVGAVNWKNAAIAHARGIGGFIRTIGGRKRRLPDLMAYGNDERARAERQCVNSIIQGSAADIIQEAMVILNSSLAWYGTQMVGQVHDELIFYAPIEVAIPVAHHIQHVMESTEQTFGVRVPIIAEPGIGVSWADAKNNPINEETYAKLTELYPTYQIQGA